MFYPSLLGGMSTSTAFCYRIEGEADRTASASSGCAAGLAPEGLLVLHPCALNNSFAECLAIIACM